jgi:hypothetical protein
MLVVGFTEKHQFEAETERNSVFLGCEAHILVRLYLMVMYIIFMDFFKNQILAQNAKVLSFSFMEKRQFLVKTD